MSDWLEIRCHLRPPIWYRNLYIGPALEAESHRAEKNPKPKTGPSKQRVLVRHFFERMEK
jgi:hypothetical protein